MKALSTIVLLLVFLLASGCAVKTKYGELHVTITPKEVFELYQAVKDRPRLPADESGVKTFVLESGVVLEISDPHP